MANYFLVALELSSSFQYDIWRENQFDPVQENQCDQVTDSSLIKYNKTNVIKFRFALPIVDEHNHHSQLCAWSQYL